MRPQAIVGTRRHVVRTLRVLAVIAGATLVLIAIGYLATTLFFGVSHSWIVPAAIAPTDERVLAVQRALATTEREQARVADELAETERAAAAITAQLEAGGTPEALRRELARLTARAEAARTSLVERRAQLAALQASPYLRASAGRAVMAMAPYDNLDQIAIGAGVYACRLQMLWCHRVGSVVDVLSGEVAFQHPHRSRLLRGRMLELRVDDRAAAGADVLFVNGAPLWL